LRSPPGAQPGQQVQLTPEPAMTESDIGDGVEVGGRGQDARSARNLGVLENRLSDDAPVTTDQDLAEIMGQAAISALEQQGFNPERWDGAAERRLTVTLDLLEHRVSSDMPRKVEPRIALSFEAHNGDRRLRGASRHTRTDQMSYRPGPEDTGEFISKALASGLERLLNEEMLRFLALP
ncbi:MAG: YajG family lipoprotein, partial [Ectothiorhodospiraceae bacterium]|nr:YajG family lipoprotein [Ectothiorhodospiraceae bacterium]